MNAGTRLGPYEITAKLGEGGMGEVYRATDTKLKRQVAIKILPPSVASDPDRLARFRREAEVLASLNHPNIAAIYGFEEAPAEAGAHVRSDVASGFSRTTCALVMELVEGEDLAQRLARGPIPLAEALPIAKQITEALTAAHDQGIIHRDLKPANIKVRDDGTVKVLDFGLAKLADPTSTSNPNLTMSPTITSPAMTQAGVILGTAAYMAPEQARGRAVDKRADIWAFGCVLFEMLTGERPFKGEDLTETLAAIVKEPPDLTRAPREVRRLLTRCLEKDPRKRLRDLGDVWDLLDADAPRVQGGTPMPTRSFLVWIGWGVAVVAVALAAATFVSVRRAPAFSMRRTHVFLQLPDNVTPSFFALSPDGRSVVMTYQDKLGVRSLDTGEIRALTGTDIPRGPFWSPESRTIGFFSVPDRQLKTIPASGGKPHALCDDVGSAGTGTWNRDGTILFSTRDVLMRVAASGGACTELPRPANVRQTFPVFLPDGDHYFFVQSGPTDAENGLFVTSLKNSGARRVIADASSPTPRFAPESPGSPRGRILFVREVRRDDDGREPDRRLRDRREARCRRPINMVSCKTI